MNIDAIFAEAKAKESDKKPTPTESAKSIKAACERLGWRYSVRNGSILTITKCLDGLDRNAEFVAADGEYFDILSLLPRTSAGSDWGTDGGGIGALTALNGGLFTMNRSGGSVRVLKALAKL